MMHDQTATTTEVVTLSKELLLAPFSNVETEIVELLAASKDLTVAGHVEGEKAGHAAVSGARKRLKELRTGIENARELAKKPILEYGRLLDGEANRLKGLILPEETRLKTDEDAYLGRVAEAKRKADAAKAERTAERLRHAWESVQANPTDVDMKIVNEGDDAQWKSHLEAVGERIAARRRLEDRRSALQAVGATIPGDLETWTEEDFDELLCAAVDAHKAAQEKEEERERAESLRREAVRRADLLTALGQETTPEAAGTLTPEQFEEALGRARKIRQDALALAQRKSDELADLKRKQAEQEAKSKRAADALAAQERALALAPEHEKLTRWRLELQKAIGAAPSVSSPEMVSLADNIRRDLFSVCSRLSDALDALAPTTTEDDDVEDLGI